VYRGKGGTRLCPRAKNSYGRHEQNVHSNIRMHVTSCNCKERSDNAVVQLLQKVRCSQSQPIASRTPHQGAATWRIYTGTIAVPLAIYSERFVTTAYPFLPRDAMHSSAYDVVRCPSVCLSVRPSVCHVSVLYRNK